MLTFWSDKHSLAKRIITCIVLFAFIICFVMTDAWAAIGPGISLNTPDAAAVDFPATIDPDTFSLPAHLGDVMYSHKGDSDKVIVHIQDAHCNYFAQDKISKIIDYLNSEYGIGVVNLEGGAGPYDLSVFTSISNNAVRKEVANYFVKKGDINGAEFYAITHPDKVTLWGIEDKDLYLANLKVYRDSLEYKAETDKYLKELTRTLSRLKRNIYGPELLKIDLTYAAYKGGDKTFREYLEFLADEARRQGIDIKKSPDLYLLVGAMELEDKINFKRANVERNMLIDELKRGLSRNEIRELITRSVEFKIKKISRKTFYEYLLTKAKEIKINTGRFPELSNYIIYVSLYESVNRLRVMEELDALEEKIKESLYENDTQKRLNRLSKNLILLKNMFSITLIKKDYEYYLRDKGSFDAKNFVNFIKEDAPRYGIPADISPGIYKLDDYRSEIAQFFEYSFERDEAFLKNIRFDEEGAEESAILMTGGFHADNLCDLFQEKDISYVSIMPKFTSEEDYKNNYFDLLAGQANELPEMLSSVMAKSAMMAAPPINNIEMRDVFSDRQLSSFDATVIILAELVDREGEGEGVLDRKITVIDLTANGEQVFIAFADGGEVRISIDDELKAKLAAKGVVLISKPVAEPAAPLEAKDIDYYVEHIDEVTVDELIAYLGDNIDQLDRNGLLGRIIEVLQSDGKYREKLDEFKSQAEKMLKEDYASRLTDLKNRFKWDREMNFGVEYSALLDCTVRILSNYMGMDRDFTFIAMGSYARRSAPYGTDIDLFIMIDDTKEIGKEELRVLQRKARRFVALLEKEIANAEIDFVAYPREFQKEDIYCIGKTQFADMYIGNVKNADVAELTSLLDWRYVTGQESESSMHSYFEGIKTRCRTLEELQSPVNAIIDLERILPRLHRVNLDGKYIYHSKKGSGALRSVEVLFWKLRAKVGAQHIDWTDEATFESFLDGIAGKEFMLEGRYFVMSQSQADALKKAYRFLRQLRTAINIAWEEKGNLANIIHKREKKVLTQPKDQIRETLREEVAEEVAAAMGIEGGESELLSLLEGHNRNVIDIVRGFFTPEDLLEQTIKLETLRWEWERELLQSYLIKYDEAREKHGEDAEETRAVSELYETEGHRFSLLREGNLGTATRMAFKSKMDRLKEKYPDGDKDERFRREYSDFVDALIRTLVFSLDIADDIVVLARGDYASGALGEDSGIELIILYSFRDDRIRTLTEILEEILPQNVNFKEIMTGKFEEDFSISETLRGYLQTSEREIKDLRMITGGENVFTFAKGALKTFLSKIKKPAARALAGSWLDPAKHPFYARWIAPRLETVVPLGIAALFIYLGVPPLALAASLVFWVLHGLRGKEVLSDKPVVIMTFFILGVVALIVTPLTLGLITTTTALIAMVPAAIATDLFHFRLQEHFYPELKEVSPPLGIITSTALATGIGTVKIMTDLLGEPVLRAAAVAITMASCAGVFAYMVYNYFRYYRFDGLGKRIGHIAGLAVYLTFFVGMYISAVRPYQAIRSGIVSYNERKRLEEEERSEEWRRQDEARRAAVASKNVIKVYYTANAVLKYQKPKYEVVLDKAAWVMWDENKRELARARTQEDFEAIILRLLKAGILNRVVDFERRREFGGWLITGAITKKNAFEGVSNDWEYAKDGTLEPKDPSYKKVPLYKRARLATHKYLTGLWLDPTFGSQWFHAPKVMVNRGRPTGNPGWVDKGLRSGKLEIVGDIEGHRFVRRTRFDLADVHRRQLRERFGKNERPTLKQLTDAVKTGNSEFDLNGIEGVTPDNIHKYIRALASMRGDYEQVHFGLVDEINGNSKVSFGEIIRIIASDAKEDKAEVKAALDQYKRNPLEMTQKQIAIYLWSINQERLNTIDRIYKTIQEDLREEREAAAAPPVTRKGLGTGSWFPGWERYTRDRAHWVETALPLGLAAISLFLGLPFMIAAIIAVASFVLPHLRIGRRGVYLAKGASWAAIFELSAYKVGIVGVGATILAFASPPLAFTLAISAMIVLAIPLSFRHRAINLLTAHGLRESWREIRRQVSGLYSGMVNISRAPPGKRPLLRTFWANISGSVVSFLAGVVLVGLSFIFKGQQPAQTISLVLGSLTLLRWGMDFAMAFRADDHELRIAFRALELWRKESVEFDLFKHIESGREISAGEIVGLQAYLDKDLTPIARFSYRLVGRLRSAIDYWNRNIGNFISRQFEDKERGVVELISNALDASDQSVHVSLEEGQIVVTNGKRGISFEEVLTCLLIPTYSTKEIREEDIIGRFGVGFLSSFNYLEDPDDELEITSFSEGVGLRIRFGVRIEGTGKNRRKVIIIRSVEKDLAWNEDEMSGLFSGIARPQDGATSVRIISGQLSEESEMDLVEKAVSERFGHWMGEPLTVKRTKEGETTTANIGLDKQKHRSVYLEKQEDEAKEGKRFRVIAAKDEDDPSRLAFAAEPGEGRLVITHQGVVLNSPSEQKVKGSNVLSDVTVNLPASVIIPTSRDRVIIDQRTLDSLFATAEEVSASKEISLKEKIAILNALYYVFEWAYEKTPSLRGIEERTLEKILKKTMDSATEEAIFVPDTFQAHEFFEGTEGVIFVNPKIIEEIGFSGEQQPRDIRPSLGAPLLRNIEKVFVVSTTGKRSALRLGNVVFVKETPGLQVESRVWQNILEATAVNYWEFMMRQLVLISDARFEGSGKFSGIDPEEAKRYQVLGYLETKIDELKAEIEELEETLLQEMPAGLSGEEERSFEEKRKQDEETLREVKGELETYGKIRTFVEKQKRGSALFYVFEKEIRANDASRRKAAEQAVEAEGLIDDATLGVRQSLHQIMNDASNVYYSEIIDEKRDSSERAEKEKRPTGPPLAAIVMALEGLGEEEAQAVRIPKGISKTEERRLFFVFQILGRWLETDPGENRNKFIHNPERATDVQRMIKEIARYYVTLEDDSEVSEEQIVDLMAFLDQEFLMGGVTGLEEYARGASSVASLVPSAKPFRRGNLVNILSAYFGKGEDIDAKDIKEDGVSSESLRAKAARGQITQSVNYQDHEQFVFIRELLQNSRDAVVEEERRQSELDESERESVNKTIEITTGTVEDKEGVKKAEIVIRDFIGMSTRQVINYLLIPNRSSKAGEESLTGFFGHGFFTALREAEEVVVRTSRGDGKVTVVRLIPQFDSEEGVITGVDYELYLSEGDFKGTEVVWRKRESPTSIDNALLSGRVKMFSRTIEGSVDIEHNGEKVVRIDREKQIITELSHGRSSCKVFLDEDNPSLVVQKGLFVMRFDKRFLSDVLGLSPDSDIFNLLIRLADLGVVIEVPDELRLTRDRAHFLKEDFHADMKTMILASLTDAAIRAYLAGKVTLPMKFGYDFLTDLRNPEEVVDPSEEGVGIYRMIAYLSKEPAESLMFKLSRILQDERSNLLNIIKNWALFEGKNLQGILMALKKDIFEKAEGMSVFAKDFIVSDEFTAFMAQALEGRGSVGQLQQMKLTAYLEHNLQRLFGSFMRDTTELRLRKFMLNLTLVGRQALSREEFIKAVEKEFTWLMKDLFEEWIRRYVIENIREKLQPSRTMQFPGMEVYEIREDDLYKQYYYGGEAPAAEPAQPEVPLIMSSIVTHITGSFRSKNQPSFAELFSVLRDVSKAAPADQSPEAIRQRVREYTEKPTPLSKGVTLEETKAYRESMPHLYYFLMVTMTLIEKLRESSVRILGEDIYPENIQVAAYYDSTDVKAKARGGAGTISWHLMFSWGIMTAAIRYLENPTEENLNGFLSEVIETMSHEMTHEQETKLRTKAQEDTHTKKFFDMQEKLLGAALTDTELHRALAEALEAVSGEYLALEEPSKEAARQAIRRAPSEGAVEINKLLTEDRGFTPTPAGASIFGPRAAFTFAWWGEELLFRLPAVFSFLLSNGSALGWIAFNALFILAHLRNINSYKKEHPGATTLQAVFGLLTVPTILTLFISAALLPLAVINPLIFMGSSMLAHLVANSIVRAFPQMKLGYATISGSIGLEAFRLYLEDFKKGEDGYDFRVTGEQKARSLGLGRGFADLYDELSKRLMERMRNRGSITSEDFKEIAAQIIKEASAPVAEEKARDYTGHLAESANPVYMAFSMLTGTGIDRGRIKDGEYVDMVASSYGVPSEDVKSALELYSDRGDEYILQETVEMIEENVRDERASDPEFFMQNILIPYMVFLAIRRQGNISATVIEEIFSTFEKAFSVEGVNPLKEFSEKAEGFIARNNGWDVRYHVALNDVLKKYGFRVDVDLRNQYSVGYRIVSSLPLNTEHVGEVLMLRRFGVSLLTSAKGMSTLTEQDVVITSDHVDRDMEMISKVVDEGEYPSKYKPVAESMWREVGLDLRIEQAEEILRSLYILDFEGLSDEERRRKIVQNIAAHESKHKWEENREWTRLNVDHEVSAHMAEIAFGGAPLEGIASLIMRMETLYLNIRDRQVRAVLSGVLRDAWTLASEAASRRIGTREAIIGVWDMYEGYEAIGHDEHSRGVKLPAMQEYASEVGGKLNLVLKGVYGDYFLAEKKPPAPGSWFPTNETYTKRVAWWAETLVSFSPLAGMLVGVLVGGLLTTSVIPALALVVIAIAPAAIFLGGHLDGTFSFKPGVDKKFVLGLTAAKLGIGGAVAAISFLSIPVAIAVLIAAAAPLAVMHRVHNRGLSGLEIINNYIDSINNRYGFEVIHDFVGRTIIGKDGAARDWFVIEFSNGTESRPFDEADVARVIPVIDEFVREHDAEIAARQEREADIRDFVQRNQHLVKRITRNKNGSWIVIFPNGSILMVDDPNVTFDTLKEMIRLMDGKPQ
ncbi:MAG: ATP-binding protein, partial [Candidatus Omnitrophica bacterium]|nr:ATP-binding protein [Candidatus Omnitrophota bacterium]